MKKIQAILFFMALIQAYAVAQTSNDSSKIIWQTSYDRLKFNTQSAIQTNNDSYQIAGFDAQNKIHYFDLYGKGKIADLKNISPKTTIKITALSLVSEDTCLIAGNIKGDKLAYALLKLSTNTVLWQKNLADSIVGKINTINKTRNNDIILGGKRGTDFLLLRCDTQGLVRWQQYHKKMLEDEIMNVVEDKKGQFLCAGYAKDPVMQDQLMYIFQMSDSGVFQWFRQLGKIDSTNIAYAIADGINDNPIIVGSIGQNMTITELNSKHDIAWEKNIIKSDVPFRNMLIIPTRDAAFLIIASTQKKTYITKITPPSVFLKKI